MMLRNEATVGAVSVITKMEPEIVAETNTMPAKEQIQTEHHAMTDKILKLPLPHHLNHLMKLFEQFETNFRLHRNRHEQWTASFEILKHMIETSYARTFKESHF